MCVTLTHELATNDCYRSDSDGFDEGSHAQFTPKHAGNRTPLETPSPVSAPRDIKWATPDRERPSAMKPTSEVAALLRRPATVDMFGSPRLLQ